ncbi:MAG TPA: hypothetical protein VGP33_12000 [Chloroflexota bacterium]|nr:hypothetical protein [Chloroflexota bacterium]
MFSWQPSFWGGMALRAPWGRLGQRQRGPDVAPVQPGTPGAEAQDRLVRQRHARSYRLTD